VGEDVKKLNQHLSLLDYLRQQNWVARPTAHNPEFVGLCPLHPDTRPSFYVNAGKNLFYCHGCGQGGDLIRFVQLSRYLSFRESLIYLQQQSAPPTDHAAVLEQAAAFYQQQLDRYLEALRYLEQRGLRDLALIKELRIGYAPGGACAGISPLKVILSISSASRPAQFAGLRCFLPTRHLPVLPRRTSR
jgi:DNA primase